MAPQILHQKPTDAAVLAAALTLNCDRLDRHEIDRSTWYLEQLRLWNLAATARIASDVFRLCAPSIGGEQ